MILSILIPTIPERSYRLSDLIANLHTQSQLCYHSHPVLGQVEVLYNNSPRYLEGGVTVGKKRDSLVQLATGKYLCFLDDDDDIPPNYIEQLLRLCLHDKDICTFRSLFKCDTYWGVCDMSLFELSNGEATPHDIFRRRPWHICPVRTEIAKRHRFPDKNNAEDWDWMERVLQDVKTEAKTYQILHQYNHSTHTSEVDLIERQ